MQALVMHQMEIMVEIIPPTPPPMRTVPREATRPMATPTALLLLK